MPHPTCAQDSNARSSRGKGLYASSTGSDKGSLGDEAAACAHGSAASPKHNSGPSHGSSLDKDAAKHSVAAAIGPGAKAVLVISLCARSDLHPSSALDKALKLKPQASWAPPEPEERFADDSWHWPAPLGPKAHRG